MISLLSHLALIFILSSDVSMVSWIPAILFWWKKFSNSLALSSDGNISMKFCTKITFWVNDVKSFFNSEHKLWSINSFQQWTSRTLGGIDRNSSQRISTSCLCRALNDTNRWLFWSYRWIGLFPIVIKVGYFIIQLKYKL